MPQGKVIEDPEFLAPFEKIIVVDVPVAETDAAFIVPSRCIKNQDGVVILNPNAPIKGVLRHDHPFFRCTRLGGFYVWIPSNFYKRLMVRWYM